MNRLGIAGSTCLLLIGSALAQGANAPLPPLARCVMKSPRLQIGSTPALAINGVTYTTSHQADAPSPIELPINHPGPQPAGACNANTQYRFGSGIYDITGPIGGNPTGHADMFGMVIPPQAPNGIHTRLYARAFAIQSPCNGKRVVFVSDDLGALSALVHQQVLKQIAADPQLSQFYDANNVMLSATHTHTAGGGFGVPVLPDLSSSLPTLLNDPLSWVESLVFSNADYDNDNVNAIVDGTVQAIRRAHANLQAHADSASITLSVSQLLNANVNRSPPAYAQDAPSERAGYLDQNGHEVDVDKRFVQLDLVRGDGTAAGVINWFAVHPTSMSNHDLLLSSDNKGYAALGFEKLMGTRYVPDTGTPDGVDNFVAGFAQTDEGDAVPDLYVFDKDVFGGNGPGQGVPYRYRGGSNDPYNFSESGYQLGQQEAVAISGTKQLAQALTQFGHGSALSGPVDYRFFYADFSNDVITDPVVLAGLSYPDEPASLYTSTKTTCTSALGVGLAAGGVNGPGPLAAGDVCLADAPSPYRSQIRTRYNGLFNGTGNLVVEQNDQPLTVPFPSVLATDLVSPLLCTSKALQSQYACQGEKPVLIASEKDPVPLQIFRIGNLAVLGVPFEVTTMSGRRLRQTVLAALSPVGVDTVVIAGLSNDYLHYMASREEYAAQMYEGNSTYAGPWQLAATQQETRKLALSMASGQPAPAGIPAVAQDLGPASQTMLDPASKFGSVISDAAASYTQGNRVDVSFVAGYPGNDRKTMASYLYVEKQDAQGAWQPVAIDHDPELNFIWHANANLIRTELGQVGPSTAEARWTIPLNTPPGTYRIRHDGVSRVSASQAPQPYEGISRPFQIAGTPVDCP